MRKFSILLALVSFIFFMSQCSKKDPSGAVATDYPAIKAAFGSNIDPNNLLHYGSQPIPTYIRKDNTQGNSITDPKAMLGRVLFYDKNLSIDNSISCGSCHRQEHAFGDTALASHGVAGGLTGRHAMRLVNARFAAETKFFWDERAVSLEQQTTKPVQDHAEMGYSGQNGRPGLPELLTKLQSITYYNELFKFVYGDEAVTEARMQECLAQFIRSIQSFDSKYDAGRAVVANDNVNFPNFTAQENNGKNLFITAPVFDANGNRTSGGFGCAGCHAAPEFDIDPNTGNNGIIGKLNAMGIDITNTRAPSLRDLLNSNGDPHTVMMHTGVFSTVQAVIGHYGNINVAPGNTNLDRRLRPNGSGQQLHVTAAEVQAVTAFLKTLTGKAVYTDARWSDPFK